MNIGIIAPHAFPIPGPDRSGNVVIHDLAFALEGLGHDVTLYAPRGTKPLRVGAIRTMPHSFGAAEPTSKQCEWECWRMHCAALRNHDIVHDFSNTQTIAEELMKEGRPTISTRLSSNWDYPNPRRNVCVWSHSMRDRALRGATDYEGTDTPEAGGQPGNALKDARVVYGGVDTDWYTPAGEKHDFFLWLGRWHEARGYKMAIEVAKLCPDQQFVLAGRHPDNEIWDAQRVCALDAQRLADDVENVCLEWLPEEGHHERKRELYRQARAYLFLPQFHEPFGLSQVEAMACGTPVIGTPMGSVSEVTEFWCSNECTAASLVDVMRDFHPVRDKRALVMRDYAVRRFDRFTMARAYLEAYRDILDGKGWGE